MTCSAGRRHLDSYLTYADPSGMFSLGKLFDWFNEHLNPGYAYLNSCFGPDGSGSVGGFLAKCGLASGSLAGSAVGLGKLTGIGAATDAAAADATASTGDALESCLVNSFPARTKVTLAGGKEISISKLRTGMRLASTGPDPGRGRTLSRPVTATWHHRSSDLYKLQIGSEHLVTTGGHRFWVSHTGFVDARNLKPGELLLRPGGRTIALRSIRRLHASRTVYDLTVAGTHRFYVGSHQVLVHNACGGAQVGGQVGSSAMMSWLSSCIRCSLAVYGLLSQQMTNRVELLRAVEVRVSLGNGREPSLIELIDGWAGHVLRLYMERETTLDASPDAWGVHDFIAAMYLRDGVERGLRSLSDERVRIAAVEVTDQLLRSFTAADNEGLLRRFQPDLPIQSWWWKIVPTMGSVAEELRAAPRLD